MWKFYWSTNDAIKDMERKLAAKNAELAEKETELKVLWQVINKLQSDSTKKKEEEEVSPTTGEEKDEEEEDI